jgi:hypothetical protein
LQKEPYPVPKVIGSIYQGGGCDVATLASTGSPVAPHQPVQQVDRLERAHHHFEVGDPSIVRKGDDIDAVDPDTLDLVLEFEDCAVIAAPLTDIGEAGATQHLFRARQILERDVAPALRRMHDGAFKHRIGVQQFPQRRAVVGLHVAVPSVEARHRHRTSPVCDKVPRLRGTRP